MPETVIIIPPVPVITSAGHEHLSLGEWCAATGAGLVLGLLAVLLACWLADRGFPK
jgi:hypothetical protein